MCVCVCVCLVCVCVCVCACVSECLNVYEYISYMRSALWQKAFPLFGICLNLTAISIQC